MPEGSEMKKKYTFKVHGFGEELNWAEISSKIAKEIINSGISEALKDELLLDSENGITSDITIEVDGESIDLDIDSLDQNIAIKEWSSGNSKKWYFLEVLSIQGLFYETVIDCPFDLKKITLHKESYKIGNVALHQIFYSIVYNCQDSIEELDFSDRKYNGVSYYILSPKGEIIAVNSNEDSEDEESDNVAEANTQAKRLYVFKEKESFDNFNKWIESELKPRIGEGLVDISEINSVVKAKNHFEVLLMGNKLDISSLPDPYLAWVQKEIGNFTIEE